MFEFRFRVSNGWILALDEGFFEGNSTTKRGIKGTHAEVWLRKSHSPEAKGAI
jgi:hypothetical protein